MSGECDRCEEHAMDCECEFPFGKEVCLSEDVVFVCKNCQKDMYECDCIREYYGRNVLLT